MFVDTPNKQAIRRLWDLRILRAAQQRTGKPLSYFGMPGATIVDLLEWNAVLDLKTCIQIVRSSGKDREDDLETLRKMKNMLMVRDLSNWQVLRGAIEDIVLKGCDVDRNVPTNTVMIEGEARFQYTLYNLDFLGGIAYRSGSKRDLAAKSLRVKALEMLFARQRGQGFTLLLTVNVRDTFGTEPATFLAEEAARVNSPALHSITSWLQGLDAGNKHHLLRQWVPLWIRALAEMQGFRCHCFPAIFYIGHEHAHMVHFAFQFDFVEGRELRVSSEQSTEAVVHLPFLGVDEGNLVTICPYGSPATVLPTPLEQLTPEQIDEFIPNHPLAPEIPA